MGSSPFELACELEKEISRERGAFTIIKNLYFFLSYWVTRVIERSLSRDVLLQKDERILNFGCGYNLNPDMVNTDLFFLHKFLTGRPRPDLYMSGSKPIDVLRSCFRGVVCEHVLEHLMPSQALRVIRNLYDLLDNDGVLVVSFPDIDKVRLNPATQGQSHGLLAVNSVVYRHGHCFMWDVELVESLLRQAGFNDVSVGPYPDLPLVEYLDSGRHRESMYLVAQKY